MSRRNRTTALGVLGAMLLLVATACGAGNRTTTTPAPTDSAGHVSLPVGSSIQHLTVDGRDRTFRVYRPSELASPAPLVVMIHGGYGDAGQAETSYGWDAQADEDHFVVAYPDGLNRAWNVEGDCCGKPAQQGVDDVAFITTMVHAIQQELPVDPKRIYATGISNGGMMSYRLACNTDLFAAIGPDSATLLGPCNDPAPLSVIHIHGLADTTIRFEGGMGEGRAHIDGPPVPQVIAEWRSTDGCAAPTAHTSGAVTTSTATCPDGRTVELITIAGAGHQWPGSKGHGLIGRLMGLDPPSHALDATSTIWAFFTAHPKS
jgi:polyhydroxybutyrate depolymerase